MCNTGGPRFEEESNYAVANSLDADFFLPKIKNKQPNKNPTLGASEPSISGAPATWKI